MKNENLEKLPEEKAGVKRVLDSTEAAQYLGISYWLIRKLVREKKIPYYKIESKTLFTKEILDKYIQDSLEEPKKKRSNMIGQTFRKKQKRSDLIWRKEVEDIGLSFTTTFLTMKKSNKLKEEKMGIDLL